MVRKLLPLTAILLLSAPALASAPPETALQAYKGTGYAAYPLTHPHLSAEGRLVVQAEPQFVEKLNDRKDWVEAACSSWARAIASTGASADPGMVVLMPEGGELWECDVGRANPIEKWNYEQTPLSGPDFQVGNLFMSFAGQANLNSPTSYGLNFAEGIVSYKRHLDILATVGLISTNTTMSIGLMTRYRVPVNSIFGVNVGIQPTFLLSLVDSTDPTTGFDTLDTETSFTVGFLGGFNFNVPTGTIDLTGAIATNGAYSLILGHTFFFSVR